MALILSPILLIMALVFGLVASDLRNRIGRRITDMILTSGSRLLWTVTDGVRHGVAGWLAPAIQPRNTLEPGERLRSGAYLESPDRRYRLVMRADGNLVLYDQGQWIWDWGTGGHPGAWAIMQHDGNFVIYGPDKKPLDASHTSGRPGAYLVLQADRNVVVYLRGEALWASGTNT